MAGPLERLEAWYAAQCDGDWEHSFGVTIESLDNPGWRFRIDLEGTALAGKPFDRVDERNGDADWLVCWVDAAAFNAACGPRQLTLALERFLDWAEVAGGAG